MAATARIVAGIIGLAHGLPFDGGPGHTCGGALQYAMVPFWVQVQPAPPSGPLVDALERLVWDARVRGPLVIVAPEVIALAPERTAPTAARYGLSELTAPFQCSIARLGSVTTLAPSQMAVIPQFRRAEDVWDTYPEQLGVEWLAIFLAELTPAQLRQAFSPAGLGAESLTTQTQRRLWLRLLPAEVLVPLPATAMPPDTAVPLAQLGVVPRLRCRVAAPKPGNDTPPPEKYLRVALKPERRNPEGETQPYRRKPSELDTTGEPCAARVALGGARTVGELLGHIRQATGIPMVADRRLAQRSVWVRGETARAGDLLDTLCRGCCGTFRKVGELYLLTEDRAGIGARFGRLQLQLYANLPLKVAAAFRLASVGLTAEPGSDNGPTIEAELLFPGIGAAGLASESLPVLPETRPVPPITLPTEAKTRGLMVRLPEDEAVAQRLVTAAQRRGFTELRIPIAPGEIDSVPLRNLLRLAQEARLPVVPVICPLQSESGDDERNSEGLLLADAFAMPGLTDWERFTGPFGFRRDSALRYKTPESVDVPALVERLARLRALPGVGGLALWQVGAPGFTRNDPPLEPLTAGYSLAARRAFLLQEGVDPIDIGSVSPFFEGMSEQTLAQKWQELCAQRRDTLMKRLDSALRARALTGPLSLLSLGPMCVATGEGNRPDDHWERWQGRALDLPRDDNGARGAAAVEAGGHPALLHLSWGRCLSETGMGHVFTVDVLQGLFVRWLAERLKPDSGWDGLVLDLSELPPASAVPILEKTVRSAQ